MYINVYMYMCTFVGAPAARARVAAWLAAGLQPRGVRREDLSLRGQVSGGTACLTLLVSRALPSKVASDAASSISRIGQVMP